MAKKPSSDVEVWLTRETPRIRRALENASRYFSGSDRLTVNTLEAVYARESSFGILVGTRGSANAAGHFQFKPATARDYGLSVSKHNDQRFDIDYAASAAARYLKDLNTMFSKKAEDPKGTKSIPVSNAAERYKFVLGAYSGGPGRVAGAQHLAEQAGKNPRFWADVQGFLEAAGSTPFAANETRRYVEQVPLYEAEFAVKSPANKNLKRKVPRTGERLCKDGHWRTIDDRPVFICV